MRPGKVLIPASGLAALLSAALLCVASAPESVPPPPSAWGQAPALQQALAEYRAGRYEQAVALAEQLASHPVTPQPRAWVIVAAARQIQGRYPAAAEAYRRFLSTCEDPALRTYTMDQLALCEKGPQAPAPIARPSDALSPQDRQALAKVEDGLFTETSEHFTVQSRNPLLSKLIVRHGEQALQRIGQLVLRGSEYPHSVQVSVYPTRADYAAKAGKAGEFSGGRFELKVDGQGNASREIHLLQLDQAGQFDVRLIDRVLPHELCHLVVSEWFGDAHCPTFLHEGLAMLAEFDDNSARLIAAGAAIAAGRSMTLESLLAREQYPPKDLSLFYAQTCSLVWYVQQHLSQRQFADLLDHVKAGCTLSEALSRTLYWVRDDQFMAQLEQAWRDDAIAQAQVLSAVKESAALAR